MKNMKTNLLQKNKRFLAVLLALVMMVPMGIAASAEVSPTEVKIIPDAVGDMNADQKIDAIDALLMLKFAVGKTIFTTQQETYADVDESGKVDVSDALMILQYSVGKRSVLPLADVMKYKDDPQEIKVSSLWANRWHLRPMAFPISRAADKGFSFIATCVSHLHHYPHRVSCKVNCVRGGGICLRT
jgi:hypothetical protein